MFLVGAVGGEGEKKKKIVRPLVGRLVNRLVGRSVGRWSVALS